MPTREIEIIIRNKNEEISISKPHIDFIVKKNTNSTQNTATVNITNLNTSTSNKIKNNSEIIIKGGYKEFGGPSVVFCGTVSNSNTNYDELTDPKTTIDAKSGVKNIKRKYVSKSYGKGTYVKQILQNAIDDSGYSLKTQLDKITFNNVQFQTGFSYAGDVDGYLKKLTKIAGLKWTINDDSIKVFNPEKPETETVIIINKANGLIGTPKRTKFKSKKTGKEIVGYQIKCRLTGMIEPHSKIGVESKVIPSESVYSVMTIEHVFDNRKGEGSTSLEVKDVK